MRTGVLLHEKTRQWRWVVVGTALLVVLVSLSLVVGVGTTGSARGEAVITGGLAFVPSRGEYRVEKRELLRTLASDNPAATVRATISLAHYANLVATQTFLERHQISAEAMWYMSAQHNFSGGFAVASTLSASAENVIKSLQDNMVFTRQEWQNASAEERLILERSLAKHQMMLEAFRRNKVMIYGIDVVAKTGALYAMQDDPMVRLVDVRLPVNAATAVPGRRRPLQPAAGTER